jgi:hypothetical protein
MLWCGGDNTATMFALQLGAPTRVFGHSETYGQPARSAERFAEPRRHQRLFYLRVAAFGTGDLARLPLRLEPVAITKPTFKLVTTGTMEGK